MRYVVIFHSIIEGFVKILLEMQFRETKREKRDLISVLIQQFSITSAKV